MSTLTLGSNDALKQARKHVKEIRGFYIHAMVYAIVIPLLWLINLLTGGLFKNEVWAVFPTVGWGIGLTGHGFSVFAERSFFGAAWQEKKVEELMARENLKVVSREKQLMQAQMRMLQAQIEPHFLFNTLANIQSLIARSPDKATLMMDNFIAYLRETLSASRAQTGTVKQEFDLLRHYLDLIKIRMAERLQFDLHIDPELASVALAPMLLQPVVENAIKHGLEPKVDGGRVSVAATKVTTKAGDWMSVVVEDNGLGFSDNADRHGTGVGLSNLRERLAVLYDGRAKLELSDAKGSASAAENGGVTSAAKASGTRVTILLPLDLTTEKDL